MTKSKVRAAGHIREVDILLEQWYELGPPGVVYSGIRSIFSPYHVSSLSCRISTVIM